MFVAARSSSLVSPAISVLPAAVPELLVVRVCLLSGVGAASVPAMASLPILRKELTPLGSERCAPPLLLVSRSGVAVVPLLHCRYSCRPACDALAARGRPPPSAVLCALRRDSAELLLLCVGVA